MITSTAVIGILPSLSLLMTREICMFHSAVHLIHARIWTINQPESPACQDGILVLNLKNTEASGGLMPIRSGSHKKMEKNLLRGSGALLRWIGILPIKIYML